MGETLRPDVAVIGASPAGLGAAREAATAGADTLLLEARDGIGVPEPPAKVAFEHLWESAPPPAPAIQQRIEAVRAYSPSGHRITVQAPAWVLDRTAFDQHLADRAQAAGARVRTGVGGLTAPSPNHLVAPEAGLSIEPRVTVFADGTDSLARRFLPLTQQPGALAWGAWDALEIDPARAPDRIHLTVGQHVPGGRTQLTPLAEGHWAHWTFVQGTREDVEAAATGALRHTLEAVGWPSQVAERAQRVAVGPDPVFRVPHRLVGEGFAVAGGAAGQGGVEVGLASGELAGYSAGAAVAGQGVDQAALVGYEDRWRARYQDGYLGLARLNRWLTDLEDTHLDRLLAPWAGQRLEVHELEPLAAQGLTAPARGLSELVRKHPAAMVRTAMAAVPAVGQLLDAAMSTSARLGRHPRPR